MSDNKITDENNKISFKAETQQLLNILIHSLYTEREIFLRELISNASDALARLDFLMLTEREMVDPELPLQIRIRTDEDEGLLIIEDSGIGMTRDELAENLGTIAHSGAKAFVEAAKQTDRNLSEIIGQFGVGFYSAFMVADSIRVTSRSYLPEAEGAFFEASGEDTYRLSMADRTARGTEVRIKLKEDAVEFLDVSRLREIVKRHSDFVQYPIFIGDSEEAVNRQTAIWRQSPRELEEKAYHEFYKQWTLDFSGPLLYEHMAVDAPAQMYALLYVPENLQNLVFSPRKEPGLKLYARKVLVQEFCTDLLPQYLNFIQGVVDSEDLPLNVSRESVQSNRVMSLLRRLVTNKVIDMIKALGEHSSEDYVKFWEVFGERIKEGVAIEQDNPEKLFSLLRFHTNQDLTGWSSLSDYVGRADPNQKEIYFYMGEDAGTVRFSPHMDAFRHADIEVLVLSDPVDPFMLLQLREFDGRHLVNIADANLPVVNESENVAASESKLTEEVESNLLAKVKSVLGDRINDVRLTHRLTDSPARLVDVEGAPEQSVQRVYQMMDKKFELPKKVLELNPGHKIIKGLSMLEESDPKIKIITEQIFENALLIEGLHPNPVSMVQRIQDLMERALGESANDEQVQEKSEKK